MQSVNHYKFENEIKSRINLLRKLSIENIRAKDRRD